MPLYQRPAQCSAVRGSSLRREAATGWAVGGLLNAALHHVGHKDRRKLPGDASRFWKLPWPRRDQDVANRVRRQRGIQQDKELTQKQAAPAEVPEQALQSGVSRRSPEVAQEGPTKPEDNSGGCAMQVRVPGTQAWLCTKEILEECTGAGVAAKHAVPSNAV
ncbi:hypothetical protein NDU88_004969 [Pleurodeles waltl]|uniref:Uncharacterized protein n=1 Tax=Pleurodeles waltl TaxID=8319 RepID=A0AAV7RKV1_PLEWA|nr:hypothetical protein NDU88_004969 [Pleurodeles waltl]